MACALLKVKWAIMVQYLIHKGFINKTIWYLSQTNTTSLDKRYAKSRVLEISFWYIIKRIAILLYRQLADLRCAQRFRYMLKCRAILLYRQLAKLRRAQRFRHIAKRSAILLYR